MKLLCSLFLFTAVAVGKHVSELTPDTLKSALASDVPCVFIEFFAPWCGHCKELAPKWEFVAQALEGEKAKVMVGALDSDKYGEDAREYGIEGFPTLIMFKHDKNERKRMKYESAREPKHIIGYINKHCETAVDAAKYKSKREKQDRTGLPADLQSLYQAFDHLNQLKYKTSRQELNALVSAGTRAGSSAQRVEAKFKLLGKKVTGLKVVEWLQVDDETYLPPAVGDEDGVVYLLARLDFRSGNRGSLEPGLEEAQAMGAKVVRFTGAMHEVDDDITYPVAIAPEDRVVLLGDGPEFQTAMRAMHDMMVVKDGRVLWSGHIGILDDLFLDTLKKIIDGAFDFGDYTTVFESDMVPKAGHDEL